MPPVSISVRQSAAAGAAPAQWYVCALDTAWAGQSFTLPVEAFPFVQGTPAPTGNPVVASGLFSLSVEVDRRNVKTGSITFGAGVWAFEGTDYRAAVMADFDGFVAMLERQEGTQLVRGASDFLRKLAAAYLPATFAESLYFNYGFLHRPGAEARGYVDLVPGMTLRMEPEVSQFVFPAGSVTEQNARVNGFVNTGTSRIHVVETTTADGSPRIGFDPFMAVNTLPQVETSGGGAGGLMDLQGAAYRKRHYRLCYPTRFQSSDSPAVLRRNEWNVTLIGADDWQTLNRATDAYYKTAGLEDAEVEGAVSVFFRGRMVIVPEIVAFLHAAPVYVPVGTTVRQLVSRVTSLPRLPGLYFPNFSYWRDLPGFPSPPPRGVPTYRTVEFEFVPPVKQAVAFTPGTDPYDLPVLAGDSYDFSIGKP